MGSVCTIFESCVCTKTKVFYSRCESEIFLILGWMKVQHSKLICTVLLRFFWAFDTCMSSPNKVGYINEHSPLSQKCSLFFGLLNRLTNLNTYCNSDVQMNYCKSRKEKLSSTDLSCNAVKCDMSSLWPLCLTWYEITICCCQISSHESTKHVKE